MVATLRAKFKPSTLTAAPVEASATDLSGMNDWSFVVGVAAGAPTDYADMTSGQAYHILDCTSATRIHGAAGESLSVVFNSGNFGGGDLGNDAWIALFRELTPASGDIPVCVAGPFLIES